LLRAQEAVAAADEKLVRLMQQDAVIRKVALTYILQRVTVGDLTSAEPLLLAAKEASKFRKEEKWGTKFATPILLQDHQDEVWYRNIRIRAL
jgi:hypothetical protein